VGASVIAPNGIASAVRPGRNLTRTSQPRAMFRAVRKADATRPRVANRSVVDTVE